MSEKQTGIPSVMKAAQQTAYGDVRDVLTLSDQVPVPRELSPKQILIRVHAASINPVNWKLLSGNLSLVSRYSFPHIPGSDAAGVIVDVGSAVKRLHVGDHVYGNTGIHGGSYAEYVRADENLFTLKPNNLTMEEAAAVPLACETSYQALFNKVSPPVGKGTKVFICGASAATGFFAIQLAKAVGASVTATCSQRNFPLMEKLGYRIVKSKSELTGDAKELYLIDYNERDFGDELKGEEYDLVYDCVGGVQQWISAQQILKRGGSFITITGDDTKSVVTLKSVISLGLGFVNRKFWSTFGSAHHQYNFHFLRENFTDLDDMRTNFIENGKVKPLIDTVFDWRTEGAEALYSLYEKSKSGKAQGKLILKIADQE